MIRRWLTRRRHNDYDINCVRWFGDRSPARNRNWRGKWKAVPLIHREMNGKPVMLDNHRCLLCNPYTEDESFVLLDSGANPGVE